MPTLRPFRDYDEKDVINLYSYSGTIGTSAGDKVGAGTVVKIQGDGWKATDEPNELLGGVGASFANTVSERYGVTAKVAQCGASDAPLGITLFDVKEVDENGELLKFNPRKAAEIEAVISGQAVPVVTRGTFLYSGATLAAETVAAGASLYTAANGEITTGTAGTKIGVALGAKDTNNHVLIKLDL